MFDGNPGRFSLPPEVSVRKERHGDAWAHVFRHSRLGDLGRVVLRGRSDGRTDFAAEIAGDPRDPMRPEREAVFGSLVRDLAATFQRAVAAGGSTAAPPAGPPPLRPPQAAAPPQRRIASKLFGCERCGAAVALLVFADDATDHGGLEDVARLMYPHVARMDVPTWVVGPPTARGSARWDGPPEEAPADFLKVWPEREPVRRLTPAAFDAVLSALTDAHCA